MPTTILIADDDLEDQEVFIEAVADIDPAIQCLTASNGEEALQLLNNGLTPLPDFIFLDLNMPRMGGKKCLCETKKIDKLRSIPVIIYSTSKLSNDINEMRQLGAVHFISKPSKLSELRKVLGFVLNKNWEKIGALYR